MKRLFFLMFLFNFLGAQERWYHNLLPSAAQEQIFFGLSAVVSYAANEASDEWWDSFETSSEISFGFYGLSRYALKKQRLMFESERRNLSAIVTGIGLGTLLGKTVRYTKKCTKRGLKYLALQLYYKLRGLSEEEEKEE